MPRIRPTPRARAFVLALGLFAHVSPAAQAQTAAPQPLPAKLSDKEFWTLFNEMSEKGGYFRSDNFLSNESVLQFVIPSLQKETRPGVYVGVGPEQNFTYLYALKPKIAFILDIRRGNAQEHLFYKALFELSADRADFLSRLFGRRRPQGLDTTTAVSKLMAAYDSAATDSAILKRTIADVEDVLVKRHHFELTADDHKGLAFIANAFFQYGPRIDYNSTTFGANRPQKRSPNYIDLMTAGDMQGRRRSYMATEAAWRWMKEYEANNLVVPLVGDFGGPKAVKAIGNWARDHGTIVSVFYVSNVEQYLFQQKDAWKRFYASVGTMPVDSTSRFVRAVFDRPGFPTPNRRTIMFTHSITDFLRIVADNKITTYEDVVALAK